MGLFKDFEKAMQDTAAWTRHAPDLAQQVAAGQVSAPPVDPDDPAFAPIDGVTVDQYARITALMTRQPLGGPDEAEAWLQEQGVAPGTWANVRTGWMNRMATNAAVRTRYGVIYAQS